MARLSGSRYVGLMLARDPSAFENDHDAEAAADAEAMVYEAGRFIDHETVRAWILSWGNADELPRLKIAE